jgi:3-hydroxy-4-methylanthranilate adenylyltransferase
VLRSHTQITDAVVVATDRIEAHVASSAELGQDELRSWCRRFLQVNSVPARYHVLGNLPRTASGKFIRDRRQLREYRVSTDARSDTQPGSTD